MKILGIKLYGILKYLEGTLKGGILPQSEEERYNLYLELMKKQYPGTYINLTPIWASINPPKEMKSYREFLEELKASNPEEYNRLMESSAQSETSEISKPWIDAEGNVRRSTNVGAGFVSGTDPIMQMYVEGVALNPVFKAIGTAGLLGLGKLGNNWAKAKLINRAMSTIDDSRLGFNIPHENVDVLFIKKPWRSNPSNSNTTMRIYPKGRRDLGYFELVKDIEPNAYSVHFKTSKTPGDIIPTTYEERIPLWNALREAIPEGSYVSTWGYLSDDGVKAVNKVGRGWEKAGLRNVHLKSGEPITIPIWYKPYNQKFNILKLYLDGGSIKKVLTGMIPIYGTYQDAKEFINNPTLENFGWAAASGLGDVFFFTGLGAGIKGLKAANAARRAKSILKAKRADKLLKAERNYYNTRLGIINGNSTHREMKQALQSLSLSVNNFRNVQRKYDLATRAYNLEMKAFGIKSAKEIGKDGAIQTTLYIMTK